MKAFAAFALACMMAAPALAARQFPPPSFVRTLPEAAGEAVAVSGAVNKVFVADAARDRVAVVDDASRVTYVPVGRAPRQILAVGFGFVTSNGDGSVSLSRDLAGATTIPAGGSGPLIADGQGRVFMLRPDGVVVVIDVGTFTARSFDTGLRAPVQHAIGDSGPLIVADASGEIAVFDVFGDRAVRTDTMRVTGRPGAMIWLLPQRTLYMLVDDGPGPLVEVSFTERTVKASGIVGIPRGARLARLVGNTLYAGFSNVLVMINLSSRYMDFVETGEVLSIDVDPAGRAFVLDANRNLRVFEPETLRADVVPLPAASTQVRFLRGTCNAYVAGTALAVVSAPCSDAAPEPNLQALWWVWNGSQSGWGLNLTHQASTLFATWFTYDAQGQPTWLVMSDGRSVARNEYAGALYRTSGPAFNAPVFDPSRVTRTQAGTARVLVNSVDYITFVPTIDGARPQFPLGRQLFSWPVPMCDTDLAPGPLPVYQGLWWNPAESGWGLNIAHQGNILFVTWFTYDTDGRATWFVGSDVFKNGNGTYSGTLYKTFGPPMTASPWDSSKVTRMPVGSVTLTFGDDDHGTFAYSVSGISGSKAITRQVFATPVTRCR